MRKDQKRKKNSPDFLLFPGCTGEWHSIERVMAGWIVSFHRHLLF
jgi:hypothetical protein